MLVLHLRSVCSFDPEWNFSTAVTNHPRTPGQWRTRSRSSLVILRGNFLKATRLTFHTSTHASLRRTCSNVYNDYQAFHQMSRWNFNFSFPLSNPQIPAKIMEFQYTIYLLLYTLLIKNRYFSETFWWCGARWYFLTVHSVICGKLTCNNYATICLSESLT